MIGAGTQLPHYYAFRRRRIRNAIRSLVWQTFFCSPFLVLSGLGTWLYAVSFLDTRRLANVLALIVDGAVFAYFLYGLVAAINDCLKARIVPYFQKRLGDINTFAFGEALANNWRQLDSLATETGAIPLSRFGFNDDERGEHVEWHEPKEALATVELLIQRVRQNCNTVKDGSAVLAELERIEKALKIANEKGVLFCLIVRIGRDRWIVPMEMDRRKGSFW